MRKILSLVLVLSLVLGSFSFAFAAPADVEGTDYEDAVTRLSALEILSGFPDGTFRPNETITRAQFAKIMVTALGVGEAAKYAAGETKFVDVPADHWAAGYINVASDMGIINGYGDGNFGPEDKVTYAQAVTMIVRGLGYEPKAQAMGGYPGGYLAVAAEKEITEDINIVDTLAATRGDVALMVDASLDVPMMVQETWGQFPEYKEDPTKTLLTTKLDVDEITSTKDTVVRVTAIPKSDNDLEENEIEINNEKYTVLVDDYNFDALLGLEVTAWADGDEIFFIEVETDEDDIKFDTVKSVDSKEVELTVDDEKYEWASDAKVYINFSEEDVDDVKKDMYGYFVFDRDEVVAANLFEFSNEAALVTEIDEEEITVKGGKDIDLEDYDDGIFVYDTNFNIIDLDDIVVDSVIYTWDESDELYIVVVNEKVSGELERAKDDEIKVDGTSYDMVDAYYSTNSDDDILAVENADSLADLVGENVEVILEINGYARHIRGDVETTTDLMFALFLAEDATGFDEQIKVFTQDGEEVIYEFAKSADFAHVSGTSAYTLLAFELNKDGEIAKDSMYVFDGTDFVNANGDDLSADYEVAIKHDSAEDVASFDDTKDYIVDEKGEKTYVVEDTIIFNVNTTDNEAELVKWEEIEDLSDTAVAALTDELVIEEVKGLDAVVVLFKDIHVATTESMFGVVTANPWLTGDGWKVEVDVFDEGTQEYFIASDTNEDDLTEGDIVEFNLNGDDEFVLVSEDGTADTVSEVDGKYIKLGSVWYKFNDAVIYQLDENGDIDEELDYDEIEANDSIKYYVDSDSEKVTAIVRLAQAAPVASPDDITLTVDPVFENRASKMVYAVDKENTYKLVLTDSDDDVYEELLGAAEVTLTAGEIQDGSYGSFDLKNTGLLNYKVQIVRISDGEVMAEANFITTTASDFTLPTFTKGTDSATQLVLNSSEDLSSATLDSDTVSENVTITFDAATDATKVTFDIANLGATNGETITFTVTDEAENSVTYIATFDGTNWSLAAQ